MTLKVYSKPGNCVQCTQTIRLLESEGIPYEVHSILDHMDLSKETGITSMPLVVPDEGAPWGGFIPARIREQKKSHEAG